MGANSSYLCIRQLGTSHFLVDSENVHDALSAKVQRVRHVDKGKIDWQTNTIQRGVAVILD